MATTPTLADEVAFISGVKSDGTLAQKSYWGWDGNNPATYASGWVRASKWGGTTAGSAGGTVYYYFDPASNWSAAEQASLASGLAMWAAVANIKFAQTTDSTKPEINFTRGHDGGAYTYTVYGATSGACVVGGTTLGTICSAPISIDTGAFGSVTSFSSSSGYGIETLLHEEGHALGLGHAGAYNDSVNVWSQQYSAYDNRMYSLMSYINGGASSQYSSQNPVSGTNWNGYYPTTWMPLDIMALQQLYGVATSTPLSGGQTFGFNCNVDASIEKYFDFTVNTHPVITLWDKGTGNTLDLSGFSSGSTVNLNAGTYSSAASMTNNIAIAYGTKIDTLVCSTGNNTVTCNADGDTIVGGAGNDTFIAGAGNDVFKGGSGTNVVKYSGASTSYTITNNADGTTTISGGGTGTDVLSGIQSVQFSDTSVALGVTTTPPPPPPPPTTTKTLMQRDFNADGKGDILLKANDNSSVLVMVQNGATTTASATLTGPGTNWAPLLTGDFNGDGKSDILWQNSSTSAISIWTMDGATKTAAAATAVPGTGWTAVAAGDFNGDKASDIVLKNGSQVQIWLMNGSTQLSGSGIVAKAAPSGFAIIATGDFNGDGNADILWQNSSTGQLETWQMNGSTVQTDTVLSTNPGSGWRAVGTGDFNGDGKSDILLQNNTSGQTQILEMDGSTVLAGSGNVSQNLGTPSNWRCMNVADYNGDGTSDILFRNPNTGQFTEYMMSGTTVLSTVVPTTIPSTYFHGVAG